MGEADLCNFSTVYNFRCIVDSKRLFRSGKQDKINLEECEKVDSLGIQTILDLRSVSEYLSSAGDKLLDHNAEVRKVILPKDNTEQVSWPMKTQVIKSPSGQVGPHLRKRYVINFFASNLIWAMIKRLTIGQRLTLMLYYIVDFIFGSKFATQLISKILVNPAGIVSSYIDMLEFSATQICIALSILSDPDNLPALVNCSLGKDRTGMVIALTLAVLGKTDDYIAEDYAKSEEGLLKIRGSVLQGISEKFNWSMDESFASAKKESMEEVLKYINKTYGSVANYLESKGFTAKDQERLRTSILS